MAGLAGLLLLSLYIYDSMNPGFLDGLAPQLRAQVSTAEKAQGKTQVHILDVGQGDCVLLCQNGSYAMIDAGTAEASNAILWYLDTLGVKKLDYVFMTHPHADHIGGMRDVLEHYEIGKVILPDFSKGPEPTSKILEKVLLKMQEKEIAAETAQEGAVYPLGEGEITVLLAGIPSQEFNNISVATRFEAPGLCFLDTGDGETALEEELVQRYGLLGGLQADVMKAGHHGSATSNTAQLLAAVGPSVIVASCGKDNSYGHPHKEFLERAGAVGAQVLRTDENGSVALCTDGDGISVVVQQGRQEEAA